MGEPPHPKERCHQATPGMGHPGTEAPASDAATDWNKNQQSKAFLSKWLQC